MAASSAVATVAQGDPLVFGATASAAAVCTATMPKNAGRLNYLTGFTVTITPSSSAVNTTFKLSGLVGGVDITYEVGQVTTATFVLNVAFPQPIPASAANTDITGTVAAIANGGIPSVVLYGDRAGGA